MVNYFSGGGDMYLKLISDDKSVFVDPLFNFYRFRKEGFGSRKYYKFAVLVILLNIVTVFSLFLLDFFFKNSVIYFIGVIITIEIFLYGFIDDKFTKENRFIITSSEVNRVEISFLNIIESVFKFLGGIYIIFVITKYNSFLSFIANTFYISILIYFFLSLIFMFAQIVSSKNKVTMVF